MLKKAIAFCGSGRKNGNTAQFLQSFLKGCEFSGATTELVHLSDLKFRGCQGCMGCQVVGSPNRNKCQLKDDITKYLHEAASYDVMCFGSPVYLGAETSMMRGLVERMMFQHSAGDAGSAFKGDTKVGLLLTANMSRAEHIDLNKSGTPLLCDDTAGWMKVIFGNCETMYAYNAPMCDNAEKYGQKSKEDTSKRIVFKNQFKLDLDDAFKLGAKLTTGQVEDTGK